MNRSHGERRLNSIWRCFAQTNGFRRLSIIGHKSSLGTPPLKSFKDEAPTTRLARLVERIVEKALLCHSERSESLFDQNPRDSLGTKRASGMTMFRGFSQDDSSERGCAGLCHRVVLIARAATNAHGADNFSIAL